MLILGSAKKSRLPSPHPPLQSWVQDVMAEATCLTNKIWPTPPTPKQHCIRGGGRFSRGGFFFARARRRPKRSVGFVGQVCQPSTHCKARRFCHAILDPTLQRRGGERGGGFFFALPGTRRPLCSLTQTRNGTLKYLC